MEMTAKMTSVIFKALVLSCVLGLIQSNLEFDFEKAPKIETHGRVIDLFNGEHFDDLLKDTPDAMRPPTLIAFFDSTKPQCMKSFQDIQFVELAEIAFPASERLMVAKYDMGLQHARMWTQWTWEKDLPFRFKVADHGCPAIAFAPRSCNGWTQWCRHTNGSFGCPDFVESCKDPQFWNPSETASLMRWVTKKVEEAGQPRIARVLGSYQEQGRWLRSRWTSTTNNHQRNGYLFPKIPQYTPTGYELQPIPKDLYDSLMAFYHRHQHRRYIEEWDTYGQTQINFHEVTTQMVSLDFEPELRDRLANDMVKPILEKWCGQKLRLTSFYGIREYPEGSFLHGHLDRIDTHVISATLSLLKKNVTDSSKDWPLSAVNPNTGAYEEYVHPPGTMLYYESSKVIHGRPSKNPVGGGIHLGCFVHFAVVGGDYDTLKEEAKRSLEAHEIPLTYRGTPSVEPAEGHDLWYDLGAGQLNTFHNKKKKTSEDGKFTITFVNDLSYPVFVYWVGPDSLVIQSPLSAGETHVREVYPSHRFLWTVTDERNKPEESRIVIATKGRYTYKSSEVRRALDVQRKTSHTEL